jgi:hypothetical protein
MQYATRAGTDGHEAESGDYIRSAEIGTFQNHQAG